MTTGIEKAVLAGGCFWGMQELLRRYLGVVSTRVGYAGGDVLNATYRNHGPHAQAIEITFTPETISIVRIWNFFSRSILPVIARVTMPEAVIDLRFSIQMSNKSRLSKRPSLMLMPPDYGREKLSLKSRPNGGN